MKLLILGGNCKQKQHASNIFNFCASLCALIMTGCSTSSGSHTNSKPEPGVENWPRIHNIGSRAILNYQTGEDIVIPIEGQNLRDEGSDFSVNIQGPFSMAYDVDYHLDQTSPGTSSSLIYIVVNKSAVQNFHSKDHLLVNVAVTEKHQNASLSAASQLDMIPRRLAKNFDPEQMIQLQNGNITTNLARQLGSQVAVGRKDDKYKTGMEEWLKNLDPQFKVSFDEGFNQAKAIYDVANTNSTQHLYSDKILSSDSRTFILFTADDYRNQVLAHQLEIQNITAFPLPDTETKKLFGDFVGNAYYAVRLTLRNPSDQDQLVSLGLIKAYGRVLVKPNDKTKIARFTMPIEISPQSQQQVYTMVQIPKAQITDSDSLEPDNDSFRDYIFGTLEFAGAMAAAYGTGFGASEDYIKAVALTTGTAFPGLEKLFPDKRPFYLLNIVNYGMPDLVKVPRGGSLDGKYLFFSKGRLQALIQDGDLLGIQVPFGGLAPGVAPDPQYSVKVARVEFDTLQIPFENTSSANSSNAVSFAIEKLKNEATRTLSEYNDLRSNWSQSGTVISGTLNELKGSDLSKLLVDLPTAIANCAGIHTNDYPDIGSLIYDLKVLQTNAANLAPDKIDANLYADSSQYNRTKLTTSVEQLKNAEQGILAGKPDGLYQSVIDGVSGVVTPASEMLTYYKSTAGIIQKNSPWSSVADLKTVASSNVATLSKSAANLDWVRTAFLQPPAQIK